jgi:hypothetical protein
MSKVSLTDIWMSSPQDVDAVYSRIVGTRPTSNLNYKKMAVALYYKSAGMLENSDSFIVSHPNFTKAAIKYNTFDSILAHLDDEFPSPSSVVQPQVVTQVVQPQVVQPQVATQVVQPQVVTPGFQSQVVVTPSFQQYQSATPGFQQYQPVGVTTPNFQQYRPLYGHDTPRYFKPRLQIVGSQPISIKLLEKSSIVPTQLPPVITGVYDYQELIRGFKVDQIAIENRANIDPERLISARGGKNSKAYSAVELKKLAKDYGVSAIGKKADIVAALRAALALPPE